MTEATDPTPEQKDNAARMFKAIGELIRGGMFLGVNAAFVKEALIFIDTMGSMTGGPQLVEEPS